MINLVRTGKPIKILLFLLLPFLSFNIFSWDMHHLITRSLLEGMQEVVNSGNAEAQELADFIISVEPLLEELLKAEEKWAEENMEWYPSLPDSLTFAATGNREDAVVRFLRALRMTPIATIPLYLQLPPGEAAAGRTLLPYEAVTFLTDTAWMEGITLTIVGPGDLLSPIDICATGSDEPDYGLDIGLFSDNGTAWGAEYGLGEQAFGNPNLEYGSQAPLHMGIYHEAKIIYKFAPFLKQTLPELRIRQCRVLAELAFREGHDYWGWRFTGWGLHYLADLAQPYHSRILPGISAGKMLWINLLSMLGINRPYDNIVQLVSNRHLAMERFQREVLEREYEAGNEDYFQFLLLRDTSDVPAYSDTFPRDIIAKTAADAAKRADRIIRKSMPGRLVSDPSLELTYQPEVKNLVSVISEEKGAESVRVLEELMGYLLEPFSIYGKSYVLKILENRK